jgi:hypothetical protein
VAGRFGLPVRGRALIVLACVVVFDAAAIVSIVWYVRASRSAVEAQRLGFEQNPPVTWRANVAKPIVRPAVLQAAEATLRPDDIVIGVEVRGSSRAYRLSAFDHPVGHLVNDMIGGVAVSVAYCDLSRCLRVYTDPAGKTPLDIEVAGLLDREMVIKMGGRFYYQRSGEPVEPSECPPVIPCDQVTPTVAKWKDWTRDHPRTDVYVGTVGPIRRENMIRATLQ